MTKNQCGLNQKCFMRIRSPIHQLTRSTHMGAEKVYGNKKKRNRNQHSEKRKYRESADGQDCGKSQ